MRLKKKKQQIQSKEECDEIIKLTENHGYEDALVNIGYGAQQKIEEFVFFFVSLGFLGFKFFAILRTKQKTKTKTNSFRKHKRVMFDSCEMANHIWERIKKFVPKYWVNRKALGLNERY